MDREQLLKDFECLKKHYEILMFGDGKYDREGIAGIAEMEMDREDRNFYQNRIEDVDQAFKFLEDSIKEIPSLFSAQGED